MAYKQKNKKQYFAYAHDNSGQNTIDYFWNNRLGWIKIDQATYFTKLEIQKLRLPMPPNKNYITGWGKHED